MFGNVFWQVEIKNMNSFSAMQRAIEYEISRQVSLHLEGQAGKIVQETRLWEEGSQVGSQETPLFSLSLPGHI